MCVHLKCHRIYQKKELGQILIVAHVASLAEFSQLRTKFCIQVNSLKGVQQHGFESAPIVAPGKCKILVHLKGCATDEARHFAKLALSTNVGLLECHLYEIHPISHVLVGFAVKDWCARVQGLRSIVQKC